MDAVQKAPAIPVRRWGWLILPKCCGTIFKHNPQNPDWVDRDRFILSNGHASMLLYSLLHLTGYDLPLSELKQFRQLHSKRPATGAWLYPWVETTTGPLGQGWRTLGWPSPNGRWRRT